MKKRELTSNILIGASAFGIFALAVQRLSLAQWLATQPQVPIQHQGISILKPLCGVDEGLAESLEIFATLPYSRYELLLGVRSKDDVAYQLAEQLRMRYPAKVRVVIQRGEPGLNPKVNQLITLEKAARYDILLISDSNVRPPPMYLEEMSAMFEDPEVGCATNPTSGIGHTSIGAMFDNMHLSSIGAVHVAAKSLLGIDFVVGKSQALRRSAIQALGGFIAYKDILAEDWMIGKDIRVKLGMKVVCGRQPIYNYATERTIQSFWERYARWGVVQRTAATVPEYAALGLIRNPIPWAVIAYFLDPKEWKGYFTGGVLISKTMLDLSVAKALGVKPLGMKEAFGVPVKDALLFGTWVRGIFKSTVDWRGNVLKVTENSRLVPMAPLKLPASQPKVDEQSFLDETKVSAASDSPGAYFGSAYRPGFEPQPSSGETRKYARRPGSGPSGSNGRRDKQWPQ